MKSAPRPAPPTLRGLGHGSATGRSSWACHPECSRGRLHPEPESATRSCYQRDRDRIIHSGAFRKLKYKTQVFVYHEGDYFRTRLTHSIEVAQIARSISRALGLNEDLAEGLALAHDLGHTPFGHAGEDALDQAMADYGGFDHNAQTFRIVTSLERRYAEFDGLNLTWEMLEGVVKHNGPLVAADQDRPVASALRRFCQDFDLELESYPSAEAQVAALSDDIAYTNHDIDDGLRAGLFGFEDLNRVPLVADILQNIVARYPGLEETRLIHETVRRLIGLMVDDLLKETRSRLAASGVQSADDIRTLGAPVVAFSDTLLEQTRVLRDFLFQRMYRHYRVNRMTSKARRVVAELFAHYRSEPNCLPEQWQQAAAEFDDKGRARLIADYIAGMTDRYALEEHHKLFDMSARI